MERGLSGLLIKKWYILMVKRNGFGIMCYFSRISPWEVLNSLRANNHLCQAVLDFQKINKNKFDSVWCYFRSDECLCAPLFIVIWSPHALVRSVVRKIFLCMTPLLLAYAINGWCDRFGHKVTGIAPYKNVNKELKKIKTVWLSGVLVGQGGGGGGLCTAHASTF